jgi:hypothetical protein
LPAPHGAGNFVSNKPEPVKIMKLAASVLIVTLTFAAAVWLLSGNSAGSAAADRNPVNQRFAPGPDGHAPGLGDQLGDIPKTASEGIPSIVTSAPAGAVSVAKKAPISGNSPQIDAPDAVDDPAMPLPAAPAPRGQVAGTAAPAPVNEFPPQSLIPATPAGESSVSPPLAVPAGARLPALFLDERPLPPPQRRVLDRVANEFIDAVASDPSGQNRVLWETAREAADRQYIKLYGHAAYNALHMQGAKEAVLEQRATAAPTPP